jgi:hypothetical protein
LYGKRRKEKIMSDQKKPARKLTAKIITGAVAKGLLALVVLIYLGLHTINFFMFTFPPEQWYLAGLGFGLTGGGAIVYLIIFLWEADTVLKKWTALIMTFVCFVGEVLAAGFGMQIEAWARNGWTMTQTDFDMMLLAIRVLAFIHALALVVYVAGDKVGELFGDHDGDGVINAVDPDYKALKVSSQPMVTNALDTDKIVEQVYARIKANGAGVTDPTNQARR